MCYSPWGHKRVKHDLVTTITFIRQSTQNASTFNIYFTFISLIPCAFLSYSLPLDVIVRRVYSPQFCLITKKIWSDGH